MFRRSGVLLAIWVGIDVWVASSNDYLDNLDRTKAVASAVLAVILWPLVLADVDLRIHWARPGRPPKTGRSTSG